MYGPSEIVWDSLILIILQGTPVLGAIISDQYLGKYRTILYSAFIYVIGIFVLFCTSLPWAIEHGAALGGLIVAMVKLCTWLSMTPTDFGRHL